MTKKGFSLLEVMVITGVTTLLSLGTISLVRNYQKSTKQMKQLGDFEIMTSLISGQLAQMTDAECTGYLPPSLNTNIYTANRSDPEDPTTQTAMYLRTEASSSQLRITGDRDHPTQIGGVNYQVILTTTDNICAIGPVTTPPKDYWCTGTLNLVASRIGNRSEFFGFESLSKGFVAKEGHLANIVFKVTPSGALDKCAYIPNVVGGAIDYGTCSYYADPTANFDPVPSMKGSIPTPKVACPQGYVGLATCASNCGGSSTSSILCCRLRNPDHYQKVNPQATSRMSGRWDTSCQGDVVTGVCNGCSTPMQCSSVSAGIIESLCRPVRLKSGLNFCNRWEVIADYCPPGATTCTRAGVSPGTMTCCKIRR